MPHGLIIAGVAVVFRSHIASKIPIPLWVLFIWARGLNIPRYEKKHRLELSESNDD